MTRPDPIGDRVTADPVPWALVAFAFVGVAIIAVPLFFPGCS